VTMLKYPDGGHYVGFFTTSYTSWTPSALEPGPSGLTPGGTLPATLAGAADSHAKLLALLRLALSCIMMQERYAVMHADDAHDRG
jgi:hypothetical protein